MRIFEALTDWQAAFGLKRGLRCGTGPTFAYAIADGVGVMDVGGWPMDSAPGNARQLLIVVERTQRKPWALGGVVVFERAEALASRSEVTLLDTGNLHTTNGKNPTYSHTS